MKKCTLCEEEKPFSEFYMRGTNPQSHCKSCGVVRIRDWRAKNPEKVRKWNRRWTEENRTTERNRVDHLQHKYGLTLEQYDAMLASQNGACKICNSFTPGGTSGRFHVDHDHTTGKIRGLLCHHCNIGLGHFKDDISTLAKAIAYLQDNSRAGAP